MRKLTIEDITRETVKLLTSSEQKIVEACKDFHAERYIPKRYIVDYQKVSEK